MPKSQAIQPRPCSLPATSRELEDGHARGRRLVDTAKGNEMELILDRGTPLAGGVWSSLLHEVRSAIKDDLLENQAWRDESSALVAFSPIAGDADDAHDER